MRASLYSRGVIVGAAAFVALVVLGILPATAAVGETIRPTSAAEADALRDRLIRLIWAGGLPTRGPDAVIQDIRDYWWLSMPNLERVDRLVIRQPGGVDSLPLVFWPVVANGRAFIVHGGHSPIDVGGGEVPNVSRLVAEGYVVLTINMPLYSPNPTPLIWHSDLWNFDTPERHALAWFLEPVAVGITLVRGARPGIPIAMTGLSGGGWTTDWAVALDTRIGRAYPVAGSLPIPIREWNELGDLEQFADEVYGPGGWVNYSELYALGAQRRSFVKVTNLYDSCCWAGDRRPLYVPAVQEAVTRIGGSFEAHIDSTHIYHMISPPVLEAIIRHDRGEPFEIQGTPITPTVTPTSTIIPTPVPAATRTPTAARTLPPTSTPMPVVPPPTATPFVWSGSCAPRPPVVIRSATLADGLAVTVMAYTPIQRIDFGSVRNATVSGPAISGTTSTFTVTRAGPGPYTVPFTVHDGCGAWQTFVGRGS